MSAIEQTGRLICEDGVEAEIVERHLPQCIALTRAEARCRHFEVVQTQDPLVWTVTERFVNQSAFDAHQERVKASDWGRAMAGIKRDYVISQDAR